MKEEGGEGEGERGREGGKKEGVVVARGVELCEVVRGGEGGEKVLLSSIPMFLEKLEKMNVKRGSKL